VRPVLAVVGGVFIQDSAQVVLPEDERAVGHFGTDGANPAFGVGVRAWAAWRDLHHLDPGATEYRVEGTGELPGPIPDEKTESVCEVSEVHQQIPRLLDGPWAVGVGGRSQNVDITATNLDREEHIDAPEGDGAVDVEEIARQHGRRLRAQELLPGAAGASRCWRDAQPCEHPANG